MSHRLTHALPIISSLLLASLRFTPAPVLAAEAEDPPVCDTNLDQRLTIEKRYRVHAGDTLRSVALLLYGHRTWWPRLQELNPKLKSRGPDAPLSDVKQIRYFGPDIGDQYVVHPGDWLIRIAEWKYGSNAEWEKIFQANAQSIKNPNLIHAGDRLALNPSGTITNLETGELVVKGTDRGPATDEAPAKTETAPPHPVEAVAPPAPPAPIVPPEYAGPLKSLAFGFACGIPLFLLILLLRNFLLRAREVKPQPKTVFAPAKKAESLPEKEPEITPPQAKKAGASKPTQLKLVKPEPQPEPPSEPELKSSGKFMDAGEKHSPSQDNLLSDGDPRALDRRPGYHSLFPNRRKKYIK